MTAPSTSVPPGSAVLSADERRRYSRQVLLPELGLEGQQRLRAARVLLVGAGGLGAPAALYLAAAGVGTLVLVDDDSVDASNLQRQVIFSSDDVGRLKVEAAAGRLARLNPHVRVETIAARFGPDNARALVRDADVVVDGSDNFPTRYMVNDACVLERTPNVFGSIRGFEGQAAVFAVPGGPCYRCLHPEPPPDGLIPSCAEAGVLGVLPGLIGMVQATEAIKVIAGIGETLTGRFLVYDALRMRARTIALPRDASCPACGDAPQIADVVPYDLHCETAEAEAPAIDAAELRRWRREGRPHLLVDVREPSEHAVASIEGAVLVPLGVLDEEVDRLARDCPIVVHCQTGRRSARAVGRLRARGFEAWNLAGGIEAWAAGARDPVPDAK